MGENLLIYDTAHDAVAFVDRVSAGLSDKRIKHIGYSATRGWLVLLYTNGNIDLYRPADGMLVNLPGDQTGHGGEFDGRPPAGAGR